METSAVIIKVLDWNQYHFYIDQLATKINGKKYKFVVGIDPDDMLVAIHLSHSLSIPVVTDVNIVSWIF